MSVRERVLTTRLIQKIDNNSNYAKQIGLSYTVSMVGYIENNNKHVQINENKN